MATKAPPKFRKKTLNNKLRITANQTFAALTARRAQWIDPDNPDPRRNLNAECGYPENPSNKYFSDLFDNDGLAYRAVSIYPNECFGVQPEVYETDGPEATPMEKMWKSLCADPYTNLVHFMHQADLESRKCEYSIILLGFDDGKPLDQPVAGVDDSDMPVPLNGKEQKLLYVQVFNQNDAPIATVEGRNNRRRGKPLYYNVTLAVEDQTPGGVLVEGEAAQEVRVHWSRVIHVAEGGKTYAKPVLKNIYKRILDVGKLAGSSAEMFYKGGFAPMSLEMDPRVLELRDITFDLDSLQEDVQKWMNGLQRVLTLVGFTAKSLAPQVANPEPHLTAQLQLIAIALGVPLRIFMGAESGQLASAQDVKNWNRRLKLRQDLYITNYIIRPLIDRLINTGAMPPPAEGPTTYKVWWPDINIPDEDEQSQIADRLAAAIMKYRMSGAHNIMKIGTFFRVILHIPADEVKAMLEELKTSDGFEEVYKKMDEMLAPTPKGPADSGSKGGSPSNPEPGGITS